MDENVKVRSIIRLFLYIYLKAIAMKILFTTLFLFLSLTCFSQERVYHPYPQHYAEWNFWIEDYMGNYLPSNLYHVYWADFSPTGIVYNDNEFPMYLSDGVHYVRQEIENQKMYLFNESENMEYDISINQFLEVGDTIDFVYYRKLPTFDVYWGSGSGTLLRIIDEVIVDEDGRVTYVFEDYNAKYIAGIGYFPIWWYLGNSRYMYFCNFFLYSPEGLEYEYSESSYCLTGIEEIEGDNMKLYPNPASSTFQIQSDYPESMSISLYNLEGKRLYEDNGYYSNSPISCMHYASGLYFIEIKQGETVSRLKLKIE